MQILKLSKIPTVKYNNYLIKIPFFRFLYCQKAKNGVFLSKMCLEH